MLSENSTSVRILEARVRTPSPDLRRPCGRSAGSAPPLLAHAVLQCARSAARSFTRISATWIAECLADGSGPGLYAEPVGCNSDRCSLPNQRKKLQSPVTHVLAMPCPLPDD